MKATSFEYRYQRVIHLGIVGLALMTYLFDRDDVVWRFVKDSGTPHQWERDWFIAAGALIAIGAIVCTRARTNRGDADSLNRNGARRLAARYWGELCYAIGLGALFPLSGFAILVGGEALRIFRLLGRAGANERDTSSARRSPEARLAAGAVESNVAWAEAFRREAIKWGLVVAMLVFVVTLRDRDADALVAASFVIGIMLNVPRWRRDKTLNARTGSSWLS
jgi:hypothetical protein